MEVWKTARKVKVLGYQYYEFCEKDTAISSPVNDHLHQDHLTRSSLLFETRSDLADLHTWRCPARWCTRQ